MVHFQQGSYIHGNCRLLLSSRMGLQSVLACAHNNKVRTYAHSQQGPRHYAHSCSPSTNPQNYSTKIFSFLLDHKLIFSLSLLSTTILSLTYIYRVPFRSPLFTKTPYIYCGLIPWAQNILYILRKWFSFTKSALCGSKLRNFDFCALTSPRRGPLRDTIFSSSKRCFQNLGPRAQ